MLKEALPCLDIFEAVTVGDIDRVQALLDQSKNTACHSADGFTPLHYAAFFNQPQIAQLLMANASDVNAVADNESRVRPLHRAAASRAFEVVQIILAGGSDPNAS